MSWWNGFARSVITTESVIIDSELVIDLDVVHVFTLAFVTLCSSQGMFAGADQ